MKCVTRPLFVPDPGWLFLLAGLIICGTGVLVPAANDVRDLAGQLEELRAARDAGNDRLRAYSEFIEGIDRGDEALIRRLAAAELGLIPAGQTPMLMSTTAMDSHRQWIDAVVRFESPPPLLTRPSMLERFAEGPRRLWFLGSGVTAVLVGLLLGAPRVDGAGGPA